MAPPMAPTPIIDSFIEKIKSPIKPHPRPLPRREGSDVMGYLKPKTSPVGRGMVCWATLFYCLFSSKKDDLITTSNANSEPVIKTNYFLDLFIKIICIICGPSLAKARNFLNGELKDKEKAEMEEITTLRVCQRTLITFNKEIFGQKQNEILSKEQCLNKFKNDGIAWIFNSSSIRGVMYENIEKNE